MKRSQNPNGIAMHRVTDCKAFEDYRLWLRFDDGLEGSLYLGNLLEIGAFHHWRDASQFCCAVVDPDAATVVWRNGIRFDSEVLYQDLLLSRAGKEFSSPELAPVIE